MYIMTCTRGDISTRTLASGWTPAEIATARQVYEARGYTVSFHYGVWK
jgi:hypothetical protein